MKPADKFIIIDDDLTTTMLCDMIIRLALGNETNVQAFTLADEGILHIKNDRQKSETQLKTVLFLDINMPVTSGWDALDMLDKLDEHIKKQLIVFMLSSSIDPKDKNRALDHPLVHDFIEKPLTVTRIEALDYKNKIPMSELHR